MFSKLNLFFLKISKFLFKKFFTINIISKNGWLEIFFVNFTRLIKERKFILKIISIILQKIANSDRLTAGYFITVIK